MEERTPSVYQVELVQGVKCGHMHARTASRKAQLFTINAIKGTGSGKGKSFQRTSEKKEMKERKMALLV